MTHPKDVAVPSLPRAAVDEHNLQGGRLLYTADQMRSYAREAILADRAAGRAAAEPEGFVLVPREPTKAMQHAAEEAYRAWSAAEVPWSTFEHSDSYRAMLAAAPTPTASSAPKAERSDTERLDALADPDVMSKLDFDSLGKVFVITPGGWFEAPLREAIDTAMRTTAAATPAASRE